MVTFSFKTATIIALTSLLFQSSVFAKDPITAFVSILPQKYFVRKIGKDLVDVQVMVQPGANPHTYEPKPLQMAALSKAKIYLAIGVTFENVWLNKIASSNPDMMIFHTDENIVKIPMALHEHHHDDKSQKKSHKHVEDSHGEDAIEKDSEHHHDHIAIPDPHIWLSPPLVKIQAKNILRAFQLADPANSSTYEANYMEFISEIDLLHTLLTNTFSGKKGTPFVVFHPSWGYFAEAYGLKQVPIEVEGKDPKPAQLMELIKYAREQGIKVVFVQPQFSSKNAEMIAKEIGGKVISIDPLALNWSENLREVASVFKDVFKH